ncbi:amino acid/amide ABC transporter membrane protein 2, HAAT family [Hoeflea sp. IMCC20628]|uniref:branched-chain amino acid ABC transporter permease n=1 Tax=Hoeflea sp. IMCC20628 TaxID=1620421 RepID=UPI00063AF355|nr:branched-chain amino acid ABC transporter permease [Hoeflea sp. IMCC20628]AKH98873.1 amino acid/amide ABC transporter membrane protein 2, HAAT family [Hoeflea sp. IMCC20628]
MKQRFQSNLVRDLGIGIAFMAVMLVLPSVADKGIVFVAGTLALHIVFGLSWNLMFGQTGLVSFGHASFFALGGYCYALLARTWPDMHPLLTLSAAGMFGALVALLVGIVALRRSLGVYFAILTLALAQIVYLCLSYIPQLGREDGFTGISRPMLDLGVVAFDLAEGNNYYYFMVLVCGLLGGFIWWVIHGPVGRRFKSIEQDPVRAEFLGINVFANRLSSFVMASALTALVGALYGPWLQLLTPEVAHWSFSARPILYALLGGVQSFWGPVVGAIGFSILEYGTRTMHGLSEIVIGSTLLAVVLLFPGGILGGLSRLRSRLFGKRPGNTAEEPAE